MGDCWGRKPHSFGKANSSEISSQDSQEGDLHELRAVGGELASDSSEAFWDGANGRKASAATDEGTGKTEKNKSVSRKVGMSG